MGIGVSGHGSCAGNPSERTRDEELRALEDRLGAHARAEQGARVELHNLRHMLRIKDEEVAKLTREIHKLKSVLEATSGQEGHPELPSGVVATPSKKQGVSGESASSPEQILIQKHDKDIRSKQLIKEAILDNDFLKELAASQVWEIVDCMTPRDFMSNADVIREGEPGSHLYVCAEGELEVLKANQVLGRMGPGKAFGELAILYNCTRTATVKAVTQAKIWVLDRRVFQAIMMRTGLQRRMESTNFLKSVPLLQNMKDELLAKMADALEVEFYPPGEYIVRQGATGDTFFIISSGQVRVTRKVSGGFEQEEEIRCLGRGEYFGEQALLREDRRTANVVAADPGVECLTLDRESFNQTIGDLQELQNKHYDDGTRQLRLAVQVSDSGQEEGEGDFSHIRLEDLHSLVTMGVGGFGRVKLVEHTRNKSQTFALKVLAKEQVVVNHQTEHTLNEKHIMMACRHSFICRMYKTYKDEKYVYMLMEACLGGEVWNILRDRGNFDDSTTRFYTACVIEALEYLHSRNIVYRDLKPENLLLDSSGYVKMADFGFAKVLSPGTKTWTFCGTPEYMAPEIILNSGHDRAADFWATGILLIELLTGTPPFSTADPMKIYQLILKGVDALNFPVNINKSAQSLIHRLCRRNPSERIGYQRGGVADIRKHRWFQSFDWDSLRNRTLTPPIVPKVKGPNDATNFPRCSSSTENPPDEHSGWDKDF